MSPKIKERLINIMINILTAGVMLAIFFLSRRDSVDAQIKTEIDSKATIEYVDKQDAEIKEDFGEYKVDHQLQHDATQTLLQSMDRKIDILLEDK